MKASDVAINLRLDSSVHVGGIFRVTVVILSGLAIVSGIKVEIASQWGCGIIHTCNWQRSIVQWVLKVSHLGCKFTNRCEFGKTFFFLLLQLGFGYSSVHTGCVDFITDVKSLVYMDFHLCCCDFAGFVGTLNLLLDILLVFQIFKVPHC